MATDAHELVQQLEGLCPRCGRIPPRNAESIAVQAQALYELLERVDAGDKRALKWLVELARGHARSAACAAGTCEAAAKA